jgi:hypothetical protein
LQYTDLFSHPVVAEHVERAHDNTPVQNPTFSDAPEKHRRREK